MTAVLEIDVLRAVGWALVHFIWQGTVIVLVVVLAMNLLGGERASTRYALATLALFASPLILLATILRDLGTSAAVPALYGEAIPAPPSSSDQLAAVTAVIWIAVVLLLMFRLFETWRTTLGILRVTGSLPTIEIPAVSEGLARAKAKMRITSNVQLRCPDEGATPAVIGWVRAVVFFPVTIATGLSPDHVELLIAHELAHVRRHDYLVNIIQSWIDALFFFHPGIRWLSARVRMERELACDEAVVSAYSRPDAYGEALARLALLGGPTPGLAVGATSSPLQARIRKLFGVDQATDLLLPRWLTAAAFPGALIAVLAGVQLATAQSAISGMLDAGSAEKSLSVIGRHEHRNTRWSRSMLVTMASRDGGEVHELRLGRPLRGIRYSAVVSGPDSVLTRLRAQIVTWRGSRVVDLVPAASGDLSRAESDSLALTFLRESGVGATARTRRIVGEGGVDGLIYEVRRIGDPLVRTSYLRSALGILNTAADRAKVVATSLELRNGPVETSEVFLAALHEAESEQEMAGVVRASRGIGGEAELVEVLRAAARAAPPGAADLRAAVEEVIPAIPSEEARGVVRNELAKRR